MAKITEKDIEKLQQSLNGMYSHGTTPKYVVGEHIAKNAAKIAANVKQNNAFYASLTKK